MIATLFNAVKARAYFGPALVVSPDVRRGHDRGERQAPQGVCVITTDDRSTRASTTSRSRSAAASAACASLTAAARLAHLSYQDIVVLDEAPNDISVVRGLITRRFRRRSRTSTSSRRTATRPTWACAAR
jgi:hypothetical protein